MKYRVKIEVSLKPGHTDPEGNTTQHLLKELGYAVSDVGVSKAYIIQLEADCRADVRTKAQEISNRLLANPTKDNYTIDIEEQK
jgi:phosphoribosylformylglycinamidine synthase PurS subunit